MMQGLSVEERGVFQEGALGPDYRQRALGGQRVPWTLPDIAFMAGLRCRVGSRFWQ